MRRGRRCSVRCRRLIRRLSTISSSRTRGVRGASVKAAVSTLVIRIPVGVVALRGRWSSTTIWCRGRSRCRHYKAAWSWRATRRLLWRRRTRRGSVDRGRRTERVLPDCSWRRCLCVHVVPGVIIGIVLGNPAIGQRSCIRIRGHRNKMVAVEIGRAHV